MARTVSRRWRVALDAVVLIILCGAGAYALGLFSAGTVNEIQTFAWPHRFSREAWLQHPEQRYHMALDVAGSGSLNGKSVAWLRATLGEPSESRIAHASGELLWDVPSPQRPDDQLVVDLEMGVVSMAAVTAKGTLARL